MAIVDKRRTDINVTEVMNVIGDVRGRTCLILDDIIDTAGTLVKTVDALLAEGAKKVYACASHPVLSGPAVERIAASRLEQLIVTNTIPLREDAREWRRSRCFRLQGFWAGLSRAFIWRPASVRCSISSQLSVLSCRSKAHNRGQAAKGAEIHSVPERKKVIMAATTNTKQSSQHPVRASSTRMQLVAFASPARFPPWFTARGRNRLRSRSILR